LKEADYTDLLYEISAPNFEGLQWARIIASVTSTLLMRSCPTQAMRSGMLLLPLICGLLGLGELLLIATLRIIFTCQLIYAARSALPTHQLDLVLAKPSNDLKFDLSCICCGWQFLSLVLGLRALRIYQSHYRCSQHFATFFIFRV